MGAENGWSVELPDEAATREVAERVAAWLRGGDLLTLSGDLGAGKTAFARALIRAIVGNSILEVPSPTFSLMQVYEGPDFPILHADFYRIRGPDELVNLGWEEAREGALTLVEWPDRAGASLPIDRLDVVFSFDAARGPDYRRADFHGSGELAQRMKRERATVALTVAAGWSRARRKHMQGDASSRIYEKLALGVDTAILMFAPPRVEGPPLRGGKDYATIAKLSPDIRAFVAVADGLRELRYSAPRIIALDVEESIAVLEDFGAETIVGPNGPIPDRYMQATALLADLHERKPPTSLPIRGEERLYELPTYDLDALLIEAELALDWYAPSAARIQTPSSARVYFQGLWREALAPVIRAPKTWTLRDYHSPNIHWLARRSGVERCGLIDFQDAVLGPPAYDLASLLQDARVDVPAELEMKLMAHYCRLRRAGDSAFDVDAFAASYAVMGAQRATKLLGIFTRLDRRDGKPQYLAHIPRAERHLARCLEHPALATLRAWFATHLPQPLRGGEGRRPS